MILGISLIVASYRVPEAKAIILIGGHITQNTTWSPVDTYRIINNTIVNPNVTLTILPGVHIQLADTFSLIIDGNLNATGTDTNPIVFTSSRVSPSPGAWNTICFNGTSNCSFILQYVTVEYAVNGITVESQGPATIAKSELFNCSQSGIMIKGKSNLNIEENTIEHNANGIGTDVYTHAGIVIVGNVISFNTQNGINLYTDYLSSLIHNVTFLSNTVSSNGQNGIYLHSSILLSPMYNITFLSNTVSSNGQNGIYLYSATYTSPIYNITFLSNTVLSNGQNGIYLYSAQTSPIYNVGFSSNTVSSNTHNGIYIWGPHQSSVAFDLAVSKNIVAANRQCGIFFAGSATSNITENSILYNQYGVLYQSTTGNVAYQNDIYSNTYGMNVTQGATVNAKYNYWGDSTGPYHLSLNPSGKGNPVNGNGTDLVFIPFLTSPQGQIRQRPVAALSVSQKTPSINETVTFSAVNSTSGGRIDYYFFIFGDGFNTSWTTLPAVTHAYSHNGTYYATVIVMDDYGLTSNNTQQINVQIIVVPEFTSYLFLPLLMIASFVAALVLKKKRNKTYDFRSTVLSQRTS
jgi:parallel beta-helix repeat protein